MNRSSTCCLLGGLSACLLGLSVLAPISRAENNEAVVARVGEDIRYLASDELEGRGPDTPGLQKAADYIIDRFKSLGIRGGAEDGAYLRPFKIAIDTKVIPDQTHLVLRGPDGIELKLEAGKDFQPLATGGSGKLSGELVFAGYGISAPDLKYDDYAEQDLAGKIVVIIRRERQQDDEKSVFNGKQNSPHAYIRSKVQAAKKQKAAAILMVNDPFTTAQEKKDTLTAPGGFGTNSMGIPFGHISQELADRLLAAAPVKSGDDKLTTLAAVSDKIDSSLAPLTQPLTGWSADLQFQFESVKAEVSNVFGVIEGEGPLANETIVIGAHYDHLGYGPFGSRRPAERAIHNGADDNATGTAAVMELARRFAMRDKKPARRMLFIGFTAEERGIIGSNRYLSQPVYPLEDTVAMINFDMIGQLGEKGLQVSGSNSGKEFAELVKKVNQGNDLKVNLSNSLGGSDHAGFYRKGIPVLSFFTGLTDLYHTPDDDYETINVPGAVKTIDLAERILAELAELPKRPEYVKIARSGPGRGAIFLLGVVTDYGAEGGQGLKITDVSADSPAAQGGLKSGDVITKIGDVEVEGIEGLATGLRKYKAGQTIKIVVQRGDAEETFDVTLGEPRGGR